MCRALVLTRFIISIRAERVFVSNSLTKVTGLSKGMVSPLTTLGRHDKHPTCPPETQPRELYTCKPQILLYLLVVPRNISVLFYLSSHNLDNYTYICYEKRSTNGVFKRTCTPDKIMNPKNFGRFRNVWAKPDKKYKVFITLSGVSFKEKVWTF